MNIWVGIPYLVIFPSHTEFVILLYYNPIPAVEDFVIKTDNCDYDHHTTLECALLNTVKYVLSVSPIPL